LLSVRESKRLNDIAQAVFASWQVTHYPGRDISTDEAALIVSRLGCPDSN